MEALEHGLSGGYRFGGAILREAIAPAFGLAFSQAIWNAGFVVQDPEIFLLVTLAKEDMSAEHRYVDHFVSDREFAWQSQNRPSKHSKERSASPQSTVLGHRVHFFRAADEEDRFEAHAIRLLRRG